MGGVECFGEHLPLTGEVDLARRVPHLHGPPWTGLAMCSHFCKSWKIKLLHRQWFRPLSLLHFHWHPPPPVGELHLVWVPGRGGCDWVSSLCSQLSLACPVSQGCRTSGFKEMGRYPTVPGNGSACEVGEKQSLKYTKPGVSWWKFLQLPEVWDVKGGFSAWSEQRSLLLGIYPGMQWTRL